MTAVDAKTISFTRRKRGRWNAEKRQGEEAHCFMCNKPTMILTPKEDGGVLARCERKGCMARGWPMYRAAKDEGYDLSAPRSVTRKLAKLEQAEREAKDAWNGLSKRGKAVAAALARLLDYDASRNLPVELHKIVAASGLPKRTAQRGIDDAVAAGMIKRRTKAGSQGCRKGPVNVYAIGSETAANLIRKHSVKVAIRQQNRGLESGHSWPESRGIAGVGESTRISERDIPYESASPVVASPSPVVASPSPVGAAEPENGRWRNGGRKTGANVTGIPAEAVVTALARGSNRPALDTASHHSSLLNQASTALTSDSEALPVERILQSTASAHASAPARMHAHPPASARPLPHARETPIHGGDLFSDGPPVPPPAPLEECGYACRGGCIAPHRHKRNAITGAMGSGDEQWIRGEKSPPRGDTPDNGKDRAKWAK